MKKSEKLGSVFHILLSVLYVPLSFFSWMLQMASEYTIGATNPVFITLIDIFCVIAFAIPLLCKRAIIKFSLGVALVGLLLFLPTGTFSYWNGWLLMGILFAPMFLAGILMMLKNPGLLQSRLDATPAGGQ